MGSFGKTSWVKSIRACKSVSCSCMLSGALAICYLQCGLGQARHGVTTTAASRLFFKRRCCTTFSMKPSTKNVIRKPSGRPATGQDPVTAIRLSHEMRATIDDWRRKQADLPGRSEAIRRLVAQALKAKGK